MKCFDKRYMNPQERANLEIRAEFCAVIPPAHGTTDPIRFNNGASQVPASRGTPRDDYPDRCRTKSQLLSALATEPWTAVVP